MPTASLSTSVSSIRRRLFLLLLQAFGAVVMLTVAALLILFSFFFLSDNNRPFSPDLIYQPLLQTYYLGHGSWENVGAAVTRVVVQPGLDANVAWGQVTLLDAEGRLVLDQGQADTPRIGQVYTLRSGQSPAPIVLDGKTVGTLLVPTNGFATPLVLVANVILPLGLTSFFMGGLTLIIGILLMRRFVTPLADVVAAAQAVAGGDLAARVPVSGPGDLRSLSDSFNHMAMALERNDQERRALLADVAHEFRTPLTIVRGRLEGIVDGVYPLCEDQVSSVLQEIYLLERLVDDLWQLTLAEAQQLAFDCQPIELEATVSQALELFGAEATAAGLNLEVQSEPDLPLVMADPHRVEQVVSNLISNALQHTPRGGRIRVEVKRQAALVYISVADMGEGIDAADVPHLFERFYRGDKSRTRASGGAGLGLAIAKVWVHAMDGQIGVESELGVGSRFWFTLPVAHELILTRVTSPGLRQG